MDLSQVTKKIKDTMEMDKTECTEAAITEVNNNEIVIDPKKIISILGHNNIIAKCEGCTNNLKNEEILHFIQHALQIVEMRFTAICHETKISEKITKILENECFVSCRFQCTHFRMILLTTIVHEFIKTWCVFINSTKLLI